MKLCLNLSGHQLSFLSCQQHETGVLQFKEKEKQVKTHNKINVKKVYICKS